MSREIAPNPLIVLLDTLAEAFATCAEDLRTSATPVPVEEEKPAAKAASTRSKKKPEPEPVEEEDEVDEDPAPKKPAAKTSTRGKKKPEPEPAPEPEDDEVTLTDLQGLASSLLEAGQRKTLKGVLDDFGIKSLSVAEEDQYDDLYDALYEAVEALT